MMGTLATAPARKSPRTDLLPLERFIVAEPPAGHAGPVLSEEHLLGKLHFIRGQRVMLDRDLAELYGVEVKRLKEQVRRNMERFPEAFMFELTLEEDHASRWQFATLKQGEHGKYPPFAFTNCAFAKPSAKQGHGILMSPTRRSRHGDGAIANVLRSERAVAVSIRIIDLFVRMRQVMLAHQDILLRLEQLGRRVGEQAPASRCSSITLSNCWRRHRSPASASVSSSLPASTGNRPPHRLINRITHAATQATAHGGS